MSEFTQFFENLFAILEDDTKTALLPALSTAVATAASDPTEAGVVAAGVVFAAQAVGTLDDAAVQDLQATLSQHAAAVPASTTKAPAPAAPAKK
jgi:hypothetical protein